MSMDSATRHKVQGFDSQSKPPYTASCQMLVTQLLRFSFPLILALACLFGVGACESASHENIEKWGNTEQGPDKLVKALKGSEHSPDLRAHAAQKLIEIGKFVTVKEAIEGLSDEQRITVMAKLAGRLWEMARIVDAMKMPTSTQTSAKDTLYYLRGYADATTRSQMDEYLVEWFVGGHYEGRATMGKVSGAMTIREIGKAAGGRLLETARGIVASPPDAEGKRAIVGNELLKALSLSGDKEALEFLMQLAAKPRGDLGLPRRILAALHFAYVKPTGFEPANGKALIEIQEKLEEVRYNESLSGTERNDAVALLSAIGAPECIAIFTRMVSYPSDVKLHRWAGLQKGIQCSGPQGLEALTEALPITTSYERGMLSKHLWDEVLKYDDKATISAAARRLIRSSSWVARVTGIELLGMLASEKRAAEDAELIQGLTSDSHRLKNWWGAQKKVPKGEMKSDPTIGEVAKDVAKRLQELAKRGGGK